MVTYAVSMGLVTSTSRDLIHGVERGSRGLLVIHPPARWLNDLTQSGPIHRPTRSEGSRQVKLQPIQLLRLLLRHLGTRAFRDPVMHEVQETRSWEPGWVDSVEGTPAVELVPSPT